jgi:hypothetical protein
VGRELSGAGRDNGPPEDTLVLSFCGGALSSAPRSTSTPRQPSLANAAGTSAPRSVASRCVSSASRLMAPSKGFKTAIKSSRGLNVIFFIK